MCGWGLPREKGPQPYPTELSPIVPEISELPGVDNYVAQCELTNMLELVPEIGRLPVSGYTSRPATNGDSAPLYALHKATMQTYVEAVYGPWDDEVQLAMHREWLERCDPQVILSSGNNGELVAVVDWSWREDDLYVGRIEVRPDRQGSGIGTMILDRLAVIATERSKPVVLEVIDINPARRLYERVGFVAFTTIGRKVHLRFDGPASPHR